MVSATYSRVINSNTNIPTTFDSKHIHRMYRQVVQASAAKKLLTIV